MPRLGAVPYLNARPLTLDLAGDPALSETLTFAAPSALAGHMRAGRLDAALLPSAFLLSSSGDAGTGPEMWAVDGVGIGSDGPVRSVLLFCRRKPAKVRSFAKDPDSLTSNALARILLEEASGASPVSAPPAKADAVLAIGDRALQGLPGPWEEILDLGEAWKRLTGLPFVYALWILGAPEADLARRLRQAAARGQDRERLEAIAGKEGPRLGLSPAEALSYLQDNIRYALGERERAGLRDFLRRLGGREPTWI